MSNTLSRVFRGDDAVGIQTHRWKQAGAPQPDGVSQFEPRTVASGGVAGAEDVPEEPPAAEEPSSPTPALDIEEIRKQAFHEGLEEGERAGSEGTAAEYSKKLDELGAVIAKLEGYKGNLRSDAEREVVDLAFAVAKRILRREVTVDPKTAVAMVRTCIDEFSEAEVTKIVVNPDDRELVSKYVGEGISVCSDASVLRGGAILETTQGRLDAQIDSQLREIELGLADR